MGTDIHFFAEKRNTELGKWEFLPAPRDGYDYKEKRRIEGEGGVYECAHPYRFGVASEKAAPGFDDRYCDDGEPPMLRDWFDDRNYSLFAMLAGVRNGVGFAGCDMGDAVEPVIPEPPHARGWPDDLCPELEAERLSIEHTPSWLTVKEMQDYFDRKRSSERVLRGVVPADAYEALRDRGELPKSWCGDSWGKGLLTVSPSIYETLDRSKLHSVEEIPGQVVTKILIDDLPEGVMSKEKEDLASSRIFSRMKGTAVAEQTWITLNVRAEWRVPFCDASERFEVCLREMIEVSGCSPENVRAVFYFDS